jgi:hypothetical protein
VPKNLYLFLLILVIILLTFLSLKESISFGANFVSFFGANFVSFIDKIFHASAYIVLTYLFSRYLILSKPSFSLTKILVLVAIVLTIYGIVIEVLQTALTENRVGEFEDVLANISGIALGSFLFRYLNSRILI